MFKLKIVRHDAEMRVTLETVQVYYNKIEFLWHVHFLLLIMPQQCVGMFQNVTSTTGKDKFCTKCKSATLCSGTQNF